MKIDADIRQRLSENLKLNKPLLERNSIQFLSENIKSPYRVTLENISSKYGPFEIDFDAGLNCILTAINDENNPVFKLRNCDSDKFDDNEISFNLLTLRIIVVN